VTENADNGEAGRRELPPVPAGVELRHLRYFLAVNEELHFGHAARRLHIAQPPLSQAIRKLEKELGVQLLHRTSRVVAPTDAGRVFAIEARRVLDAFEFAVTEARRAGEETASLRIGCVPNLPIEWLIRFLRTLHELVPAPPPNVVHLPATEQMERLRAGALDLGIIHRAGELEDLELEELFEGEPLAAYLPPEHPLTERDPVGPQDLHGEALVIFPRSSNPALYDRLLSLIEQAGYSFEVIYEAGGHDARDLLISVASGRGIALGPVSVKEVTEAGSLVVRRALDPPLAMPQTVLAWRRDPPRRVQSSLAAIREVAANVRRSAQ
jgi:DNA-binding transcriptional LysR family regulator